MAGLRSQHDHSKVLLTAHEVILVDIVMFACLVASFMYLNDSKKRCKVSYCGLSFPLSFKNGCLIKMIKRVKFGPKPLLNHNISVNMKS